MPSRSRELQRARRNGRGNERRGGAFGNRNRMSFTASCPAIIAAQKGRLGNASAQNTAQVKQYRCVICCLGCVFPAGAVLQTSLHLQLGPQEDCKYPSNLFLSLGLSSVQRRGSASITGDYWSDYLTLNDPRNHQVTNW